MPAQPARTRSCAFVLLLLALCPVALADTVILKSGKKLKNVVVSSPDGADPVVINPFNSRNPDMTWEIPDKNRIPLSKVEEVIIADPPLVEYRKRASRPELTAAEHLEIATFCKQNKFKQEAKRHLQLALALEPENLDALDRYGEMEFRIWAKGNPLADPDLKQFEQEYLKLEKPTELAAQWSIMKSAGTTRKLAYLERARRSAKIIRDAQAVEGEKPRRPRGFPSSGGRREKVPLTLRSDEAPGATYCIYVPAKYDPLTPTALAVGLHGGGRGGKDDTLVTGSGESAMNFFIAEADRWNCIVVCPTALSAGWSSPANEPLMEALLEEMRLLYNVDLNRIYVVGHSMGGGGTWYWGPKKPDVWAACSPNAGWNGGVDKTLGREVPIYIYHGADDGIVGPRSDRLAAKTMAKSKKKLDFVYTELKGVGHGWPGVVRKDIFDFFAGRWKDKGRKRSTAPASSFDRKVSKEEIKTFGDPSKIKGADEGDARLKDLVAALRKGGGGGQEAVDELSKLRDPRAVKAVAKVLRSKKATTDSRVLAAYALGGLALPESIKPLTSALTAEDYRILEASTKALGMTGLEAAAPSLVKAGKRLGERFDGSFLGQGRMTFREYQVRLGSFEVFVMAFQKVGNPDLAIPALEKEVVKRVFTGARVDTGRDPRFIRIPPESRRTLCRRLADCFSALNDPRGVDILRAIAKSWEKDEPRLARVATDGADALKAALDAPDDA